VVWVTFDVGDDTELSCVVVEVVTVPLSVETGGETVGSVRVSVFVFVKPSESLLVVGVMVVSARGGR